METTRTCRILLADDDPDDQMLARDALREAGINADLHVVDDGLELLDYLRRRGKYVKAQAPRPDLILLDLNMPRMNGHEVLEEIKKDPRLETIPIVVLTTSQREEDVVRTYALGGNSFISKPPSFPGMVDVMAALDKYWFKVAELPANP